MDGPQAPSAQPDADELARLDHEIPTLRDRAIAAHQAWVQADASWRAAVSEREALATRLAMPRSAPPAPGPAFPTPGARPPQTAASARGTEASTRTVQNVLFVLGGLLLGTAAIAFTAVAWTTFGVGGRAAILALVTLVALGIPLLALARKLTATAETFAAIGLLLVVLDGYAAWYVDLGHVQSMPGTRYAGLVALATSGVALGYRFLTRLSGPAFVSLLAVQPVMLLIVDADRLHTGTVSLLMSATAAVNTLVAYRTRTSAAASRGLPAPAGSALVAVAWVLCAVWLVVALPVALLAEVDADSVTESATAGAATVAVALLILSAARYARSPVALRIAAAVVVVAVAVAADFLANEAWPGHPLLLCAVVALGLVALTAFGAAFGAAYGSGARVGGLVVAGIVATVTGLLALSAAAVSVAAAIPIWSASLGATGPHPPVFTWELPASALVLAAALLLNAPQWSRPVTLVTGTVVAVLALPASVGLYWWAPASLGLGASAVLAVVALTSRTLRATVAASVGSAVMAGFAVLTGAARPGLTALVLAGASAIGITLGTLSRHRAGGSVVGPVALFGGLVAIPPAIGAALVAWHVEPWWAARGTVIGVGVLLAAIVAVRAWAAGPLVHGAFVAALLSAVLWPAVAVGAGAEPLAVYAGVSLVLIAATVVSMPAAPSALIGGLLVATLPGLGLAGAVLPAVLGVVAYPYSWVTAVWTGRPAGVGLTPSGTLETSAGWTDAVGLGLLAVACGLAAFAAKRTVWSVIGGLGVGGPTAILVSLAVAGAPWPSVPAATLLIGLALVLSAALARNSSWRTVVAVVQGIVYIGAGIAGSLGVEWATLAALGMVVVAGAVVGVLGRDVAWRVAGLLVAVGFAAAQAATAGFAADLRSRDAAIGVLGVAVVALFIGALILGGDDRRPAESTAIQAAAHATAVVALLFTIGWREHTAGLSAAWGIALGVRALLPRTGRAGRATLAAVAAGFELLAWWLLLVNRAVTVIEAYTLPLALAALLAGFAALRSRPDLRSWVAYGPALAAAFLPSLAAVITTTGEPWRRLALGAGALAVVVVGSTARRQAPVVIGGLVLSLVALHELALLWQYLPGWVPLAVGGVILVGLAITYERRLRDLGRLRSALGRMT
jgi:hypothetical protein